MAITDTDLLALLALSETERRPARRMPKGIGAAALDRLASFQFAEAHPRNAVIRSFSRTENGTRVLRTYSGRLEVLRRMGKLTDAQAAELAAIVGQIGS